MAGTESIRAGWTPADGSLLSHKDSPGTDIFRNQEGFFIVRSDLGCYLQTKDLKTGEAIKIRKLHPACQGGDHYLSDNKQPPNIYILKGSTYRVVKDLSTDAEAKLCMLDPFCRGGDHYMHTGLHFCILHLKKCTMSYVFDLSRSGDQFSTSLPPQYCEGLYYFGIDKFQAMIKVDKKWGVQYFPYNVTVSEHQPTFSVHPDVLNFLPGGLSFTKGAAIYGWECIKTVRNDSDSSITWSNKIAHKVGYAKKEVSSMERNWSISPELSVASGKFIEYILKIHLSLKGQYGRKGILTEEDAWNEAREEEETITVTVEPKKNLYVWQHRLSIGKMPILFYRDIQFTKENNPPDYIPLSSVS